MLEIERLGNANGASVISYDGKIILEFWLANRAAGEEPLRIELSLGQALDLAGKIVPQTKSALADILGMRP